MQNKQKERRVQVRKIGKQWALTLLLLLTTLSWAQEQGSINASASRTTVDLNEAFRVTFSTDMRQGDIQPPKFEHFIIVRGPFQSQQTQIINGNISFRRELSYELVAETEGTYSIAPATINIRGKLTKSNPLEITVKAGAKRKNSVSERARDAFHVDILTSKKQVYVGEPIVMLYRATLFEPVRDMNIIQSPNYENVLQQQLEFQQDQRIEIIEGKRATVLDFDKRLLIPNKPGTLGGEELKITGLVQVPTGKVDFWGMPLTKFVQEVATANIPAVKILPLPTPAPEHFSGAVGVFKFIREISTDSLQGNESLTIKLRVEGTGNFNTISVPELEAPQGFDVYDPKFNENIKYSERGVRGYKELEYLLVPQFRGQFIVPEMRWSYFNTATGSYEEVVIPQEEIKVYGDGLAQVDTSATAPAVKREVSSIDEDIRYLQYEPMAPFEDLPLRNISAIALVLLGLAWMLQAWVIKEKVVKAEVVHAALEKRVSDAFAKGDSDRFAVMINALEERLIMGGMHREEMHAAQLVERYGEELGRGIHSILERCQMAQYAPFTIGSTQQLQSDFDRIWKAL